MEKQGGLTEELKQKISRTKVAIIGNEAVDLIQYAIKRMGFMDTVISTEYANLPECDVAICTSTTREDYKNVLTHYKTSGISVIGAFNFGIGACVAVFDPASAFPHIIEEKHGEDAVESMLNYAYGYSKFWVITQNGWLEYAAKWMTSEELCSSIGENTMTAMAAHLLIAVVEGNKVKKYPKFYLSTIANDVN
ncbi:MAG: hypothetical protein K2H22_03505 [Muribaculaceae bacterium]|nr:hypothetical protein [Muribaculaceae bacterium]